MSGFHDEMQILTLANKALDHRVARLQSEIDQLERQNAALSERLFFQRAQSIKTRRFDLEGKRITGAAQKAVYLVLLGRRHLIAEPAVAASLFASNRSVISLDGLDDIEIGADLLGGTSLIKSSTTGVIYLAALMRTGLRLFHIHDFETFLAFDFAESLVHEVPVVLVAQFPIDATLQVPYGPPAPRDGQGLRMKP